jgi:uncharacterized protein (DUF302 family)
VRTLAINLENAAMTTRYGFGKPVGVDFDTALARVIDELKKEGFGVLTEIDVKATMKKKLNVEMRPYRILGACNPTLAHRALTADPQIGLLLPCNVVVREDDAAVVHVEFMDPGAVLELVDKAEVTSLASEVKQRLERVMAALA